MTLRVRAPMPAESPRRRGWPAAAMPIVGLALFELARVVFARHGSPTDRAVFCAAVILIEAIPISAGFAARTTSPLGATACIAALGMFAPTYPLVRWVSHPDPLFHCLIEWHELAFAWLLAFALGCGLHALVRRAPR